MRRGVRTDQATRAPLRLSIGRFLTARRPERTHDSRVGQAGLAVSSVPRPEQPAPPQPARPPAQSEAHICVREPPANIIFWDCRQSGVCWRQNGVGWAAEWRWPAAKFGTHRTSPTIAIKRFRGVWNWSLLERNRHRLQAT